jgi:hypothetical protein
MRLNGVRNVLATVSAVALLTAASGAMAQASDPLAQLLVKKGLLTNSDLSGVATRDQLTNLLVRKGLISSQDAATLPPPPPPTIVYAAPPPGAAPASPPPLIAMGNGSSPFAFRVGNVNFLVGGFLDFETIIRSSNTGNVTATNFGAIPFSNTVAGHQHDLRLTAQNTRLSLKATSNVWGSNVTGYGEMDFNGNDASNVFVNSNSHTARLRLAYVDVMRGPFELQAGQLWSWVTPNRFGLSADPNDVWTTYNFDENHIVGLNWTRQAAIRAVWHPNQNLALGVSVENPDQFIGSGEVIFPFAFNAQLAGQFDANNQNTSPNYLPDIIPKIAFDSNPLGMRLHAEAVGLFRGYRIAVLPVGGTTFDHSVTITKAGGVNASLEVVPHLMTLVGGAMYGEAIGRYAGALGPDVVVKPIQTGPASFNAEISPVSGASGVLGMEFTITPNDLFAAYAGASFFHSNYFTDPTNPVPGRTAGFGGPNSPNAANKLIKELSFDYIRTIWQDPQYGRLAAGAQYSAVVRKPWFVATGAPKDAVGHMGFLDLRYYLPAPVAPPAPPPPP